MPIDGSLLCIILGAAVADSGRCKRWKGKGELLGADAVDLSNTPRASRDDDDDDSPPRLRSSAYSSSSSSSPSSQPAPLKLPSLSKPTRTFNTDTPTSPDEESMLKQMDDETPKRMSVAIHVKDGGADDSFLGRGGGNTAPAPSSVEEDEEGA